MAMIVNAIVAASTVPSAEESDMVEKRSTPLMIRAKIGTANSNARLNLSWLSPCLIFFFARMPAKAATTSAAKASPATWPQIMMGES